MSAEFFNEMFTDQQTDYLWDNGVFLDEVIEGGYVKKLYSLHDYFVEVYFNLQSNKCETALAITEPEQIDRWVSDKDIEKWFS